MVVRASVSVMHLVEASPGEVMYGKERVIHRLMHAQRDAGDVATRLAVFAPCVLASAARDDGFAVDVLGEAEQTVPVRAMGALRHALQAAGAPILHTHGYKANVVGRMMRMSGARMAALVSTCHGFVVHEPNLRLYNALDRFTAGFSDVVTAPDPGMLRAFPAGARTRFVPNAIADLPLPDVAERATGRASFGWDDGDFVAGMLGRLSAEKGVENFLAAALSDPDAAIRWIVAGSGPLESDVRAHVSRSLSYLGFLDDAIPYLTAIDVYVQPSFTEGLSLSLLEAMRAGRAIVATGVGATREAVRDGVDALVVEPDPVQIVRAVLRLRDDASLRARLGASARQRFEDNFRMSVIERRYAQLYRDALARRSRAA